MMRRKYGFIILFCVVLSALYVIPGFAAEWLLGEVYMEDYYQEADMESYSVASASDAAATGSDADYGIMLLSSYETFDTGSISSTVVNYMSDVIPKLGNVHYVLFRSGQYTYRLYYSKDLEYAGNGSFRASEADCLVYDTRYYTWTEEAESDFSLSAGNYLVYSDLGGYPMLSSGETSTWLLVVLGAVYFVFIIVRSLLAPSKYVI